jgi:hypothetical protein
MPLSSNQKNLLKALKSFKKSEDTVKLQDEISCMLELTPLNFFEVDTGWSVLHHAVSIGNLIILQSILNQRDIQVIINAETKKGNSAIKLAAASGEYTIFKMLHEYRAKYSPHGILQFLQIKIDSTDNAENFKKIKNFIYRVTPKRIRNKHNTFLGIYGYPLAMRKKAEKKEYSNQVKTTEKFFRVGKLLNKNKKSTKLYEAMLTAIGTHEFVKLDGYSARAVVIAISKLLQKNEVFPKLVFTLGETELSCNPAHKDNRRRQIGNLVVMIRNLNKCPSYGEEIMNYLSQALGDNRERENKIGILFQTYSKIMTSFTLDDFNTDGQIKLSNEESYQLKENEEDQKVKNAIFILNFINFMHVVGEVTRRLYRDGNGKIASPPSFKFYSFPEPKNSDEFPVASFHARVIELMRVGTISLNDIYGVSDSAYGRPRYGVVAGKDTIRQIGEEVKPKGFEINSLMSMYHAERYAKNYSQRHSTDYLVTRPFWIRVELGDQFGGDSESGGSSYSSDQSDTEYLSEDEEDVGMLQLANLKM